MSGAYRDAGVDVEAGRDVVRRIAGHAERTRRPEVLAGIGSFGSLFRFDAAGYDEPVLVSATDGVGTKLRVAIDAERHDTVGIDLVAMVVNDLAAQGAEPLFFLDYVATGALEPAVVERVVAGIADGCVTAGCALVGGETAEMPSMYAPRDYDLAGFAVGVVDRPRLVDGSRARAGDVLLGLASSGLHANGFSLVRKLLFADRGLDLSTPLGELPGWSEAVAASGAEAGGAGGGPASAAPATLADLLLTPTRIYAPAVRRLQGSPIDVRGLAHVTGGGLDENLPRALAPGLRAEVVRGSWPLPTVFRWLASLGGLGEEDLVTTFNCGIGMVVVVAEEEVVAAERLLREAGETVHRIGRVVAGPGGFRLTGPAGPGA